VTDGHAAAPAAVAAAAAGELRGIGAAGRLAHEPDAPPADPTTPFDLASVTKPIVALTWARLVRTRALDPREPLEEVLPAARGTRSGRLPIELFVAHRAGLEAHIELFAPLREGRAVDAKAAFETALESRRADCPGDPPAEGFAPLYSDMGYLLLGAAIEERAGRALDEVVLAEVLRPLGLDGRIGSVRQLEDRSDGFAARVAPTEVVPFRGGLVRGVVHDENAWALRGRGLAGHAGLFGDAGAVLEVGVAVLDALHHDGGWLAPRDVDRLVRPRPGGTLRAGFDGRAATSPSSGARLGPRTFGHLGFTGTSLWIDPDSGFVGVLLSNRVHPSRDRLAIRAARPAAYDAMFDALEAAR
jgi:CubicO group peptidase (beta-lactamase class C family)